MKSEDIRDTYFDQPEHGVGYVGTALHDQNLMLREIAAQLAEANEIQRELHGLSVIQPPQPVYMNKNELEVSYLHRLVAVIRSLPHTSVDVSVLRNLCDEYDDKANEIPF